MSRPIARSTSTRSRSCSRACSATSTGSQGTRGRAPARAIIEYFARAQAQLKRDDTCGELAREERNPAVERELQKLFEGKKGLERIYEQLERQLGEAASYVNDLEGESSASDVDSASAKADELERSYEQLDRARGRDDDARRRLEAGRTTLRGFREALRHLKTLEQGQFLVDRAEEKCREAEGKLRDTIRSYTDSRSAKGVKEIPPKARAIGDGIEAALQKADEQHRVMETERNEALRFEAGDGRWRDVRDQMKDSTSAIWDHWKRAWEKAHTSCDALAKGEDHELVKKALDQLRGGASALIADFRKDVDAWFDLTREAFKLDCAAMNDIWGGDVRRRRLGEGCVGRRGGGQAGGRAHRARAQRAGAGVAPRMTRLVRRPRS